MIATASDAELIEGTRRAGRVPARRRRPPLLMTRLREEHGVRSVLCEGGPTLNSHLLAAGLVDELFLTLNPKLAGGAAALTIVAGRELEPAELELVSLAEGEGDLFTRWRVKKRCSLTVRAVPLYMGPDGRRPDTPTRSRRPRPPPACPSWSSATSRRSTTAARWGLERASMRIGRGEFVFLVGPTGCGKSTCIRLLHEGARAHRGRGAHRRQARSARSRASGCRSCAATSAWSSRTTSCCPTARCTTTWPTRSR